MKDRKIIVSGSSSFAFHPVLLPVVILTAAFFVMVLWSPPVMYSTISEWYVSWQKSLYSYVCHQQIERMFAFKDIPLAVCSRCTGIYSGFFVGILTFLNFSVFVKKSERYIIPFFFWGTFVLVLDAIANLFHIWSTPDLVRLLIGLFWGVMIGTFIVYSLIIPTN